MGGLLWTNIAAWTVLCSLWMLVFSQETTLFQDLGLDNLPDAAKINISQEEYMKMMDVYLKQLQTTEDPDSIPKLVTFNSGIDEVEHSMFCTSIEPNYYSRNDYYAIIEEYLDRKLWRRKRDDIQRLRFSVKRTQSELEVESAELRLLAPPMPGLSTVLVQVYQVLSARRRRLLEEREIYVSPTAPKWCHFDITKATRDWLRGEKNLGLELQCAECNGALRPVKAALSALVYPKISRVKRSSYHFRYGQTRRSDCKEGDTKKRCCRHEMHVTFNKLNLNQMESIIQPKSYEAGFCKGRCPPNYNYATNHSRIQSLVHRLNKEATPRVCCAPSKLESLEILRVDPLDNTKLVVEKWDNMKVLECACS